MFPLFFREHLGVKKGTNTEVDVTDPVIDTFYKNQWIRTAAINTSVYDKVQEGSIFLCF